MTDELMEKFIEGHFLGLQTMTSYLRMIHEIQCQTSAVLTQFIELQTKQAIHLQKWKEANPEISAACREASNFLGKKQSEFIKQISDEIAENIEQYEESPYLLSEFLDKNGPRIYNLNLLTTTLAQLS